MPTAASLDTTINDLFFGSPTLSVGDAIVHFDHGLAAYDGSEECDLGDEAQTLVSMTYRDGGKLLVSAQENRDFWQYGLKADYITLDRLDAGDWVKRRDEMIGELIETADRAKAESADRRRAKAIEVIADDEGFSRFEDSCTLELTTGQRNAIRSALDDMASGVPMDRLLIGDVGFGKTEVALHAAAAAVSAGHQVVIVAPTTVLASQHHKSFTERLAALDVEVVEVSRRITGSQRAQAISDISDGTARVVVATHAILGDDIAFKDLALAVIDEEQRFGTEQKQGIRALARGVHVLSMTATPIPRSLAFAELGLLDISVITTPLPGRRPVQTTIERRKISKLLDALKAKTAGGRQAYVVCPRIRNLKRLKRAFKAADPEFSYAVAHGKMSEEKLSRLVGRFMAGEIDVLLSTSIIESGLDNARADAMFVWNANKFGLAQLHQLRGRVGRSDATGTMHLLSKTEADAGTDVARRLNTLCEMDHLGSGFEIARVDRDMRGFGKLTGEEQSGHVSRLGIGLYRHILKCHIEGESIMG